MKGSGSTPRSGRTPRNELTPTQQKQRAEEKIRAAQQRRLERNGLGPGAYEPRIRQFGDTSSRARPSAWGKSRTPRQHGSTDRTLRDVTVDIGPGLYQVRE